MNALIIEDEMPSAEHLIQMLTKVAPEITVLQICKSNSESVKWLKTNPAPDLIFMDIELSDGKSFDIFNQVTITVPVIFTTAYNLFAIKALKFNAVEYLLKPYNQVELLQALHKVQIKDSLHISATSFKELQQSALAIAKGKQPHKIKLRTTNGSEYITIKDIIRFEADSDYTHIFINPTKKLSVVTTIKEYDDLLSDFGFYMVQRNCIINIAFIKELRKKDGSSVIMKDGTMIEVSQIRKQDLLTAFSKT